MNNLQIVLSALELMAPIIGVLILIGLFLRKNEKNQIDMKTYMQQVHQQREALVDLQCNLHSSIETNNPQQK